MPKKKVAKARFTLETFRSRNSSVYRSVCSFKQFRANLSEPEKASLDAALADPSIQASAIHKVLIEMGYTALSNTVRKHRRGECGSCFSG